MVTSHRIGGKFCQFLRPALFLEQFRQGDLAHKCVIEPSVDVSGDFQTAIGKQGLGSIPFKLETGRGLAQVMTGNQEENPRLRALPR
jgi:hypothetical protein